MDTKCIRVFVAHRDAMTIDLLVAALNSEGQFTVVGSSNVSTDILAKIGSAGCDVALISSAMHDGPLRGYWVLRAIRDEYAQVSCVMLLEQSERRAVVEAFRGGAKGVFCSSESGLKLLCKCVASVCGGQIWATNREFSFALDALSDLVLLRLQTVDGHQLLTRREEQLVELLAEGLSNREIAQELRISQHTVKNYLFRMFDKAGVSNRVELLMHAVNGGRKARVNGESVRVDPQYVLHRRAD
jgi:DNA-binding NarL/FixJ family response regulator